MGSVQDTWAGRSVRRFRWMLCGVGAAFVGTELVALTGRVPHVEPVSLRELFAQDYYAIGFGCPLLLHVSSLPGWRELGRTAILGGVLVLLLTAAFGPVSSCLVVAGLGLASALVMASRALCSSGRERTAVLVYLLPALVALLYTVEAGIFLNLLSAVPALTDDSFAYVADAGFGGQVSFAVGRLFAALPALAALCTVIYEAPPPGLIFVYALQVRARRPPPVEIVTALLALAVVGYASYFLFPICGPKPAFGGAFPDAPPPVEGLIGLRIPVGHWPRNGMPSLHLGSVLLAYWHARPYGPWARGAAAVFVVGTFLATLGLGEHYLVDLVVALPFTLALQAALTPGLPSPRAPRRDAFLGAAALVAAWYALLLWSPLLLLAHPALTWGVALGTLAAVWALEHRLYRATQALPESEGSRDMTPTARTAPGPRGVPLLGNLPDFRRDVLKLLLDGRRDFGDVVRFRLGPLLVHLVAHPEHVKRVLVTNQHNYNKATRSSAKIRSITGEGLLTSNSDFWLRQRRLMQPALQPQQVAAFTGLMTDAVAARLRAWQQHVKTGEPLDVASEMMRLTYTIVGRALFGADVTAEVDEVEDAAGHVMAHAWHRLEKVLDWPDFVPTPRNRRFRAALNVIDRVVYRIIEERRRQPGERTDLLSLLLAGRDEETGGRMSETQLRNEAVTLLLAGHETTANALTWLWYLLAKHPEAARRVRAEAAEILGGRPPTFADLTRLKYTTLVIQEAMRLYPPIWIMERHVLADDAIGGYRIPGGSALVLCPYVTHRHPEFWDDPERFDPERFLPERGAGRPHYAYFPFGGGQRLCIGSTLAMTEAQVITAMTAQQYRLELPPGSRGEPQPGITLRVRGGLPMTVHASDESASR